MNSTVNAFMTVFNHVMELGTYNENMNLWHFTGMDFATMKHITILASGSPTCSLHLYWYDGTEHNMRGEYVDVWYYLDSVEFVRINRERCVTARYLHFADVLENLAVTFVGNELPNTYILSDKLSRSVFDVLWSIGMYLGRRYETSAGDTLFSSDRITLNYDSVNGCKTIAIRNSSGILLGLMSYDANTVTCNFGCTPAHMFTLVNKLCFDDLSSIFITVWRYVYFNNVENITATIDQHISVEDKIDLYLSDGEVFYAHDSSDVALVCSLYNKYCVKG